MVSLSKIRLFFIIILVVQIVTSCSKKNDVIPDVTVDFTINLTDPQFTVLNAFGFSVTVNAATNNWGHYAAGFDGNGIIVTSGVEEFFAYDRTCPYDYAVNKLSIRVNIDSADFTKGKCPECGTTYQLTSYGTPVSGVGKYQLKNYKTSFDGRNVRVWNNY